MAEYELKSDKPIPMEATQIQHILCASFRCLSGSKPSLTLQMSAAAQVRAFRVFERGGFGLLHINKSHQPIFLLSFYVFFEEPAG